MNNNKDQRDAEVVKTLGILDDMPRVEPHHLFRARLLERIDAEERRPAVAGGFNPRVAFFGLLLAVNIGMGALMFTHQEPQTSMSRPGDTAESVNEEYGSPALSYYEQAPATDPSGNETDQQANQ